MQKARPAGGRKGCCAAGLFERKLSPLRTSVHGGHAEAPASSRITVKTPGSKPV